MAKVELTQELVREILDYDPEMGEFTWKERDRKWFDSDHGWKMWNGRFAGKQGFFTVHPSGFLLGMILGKAVYAHRLAFLWMTGEIPPNVDFADGNKTNVRWSNLVPSNASKRGRRMAKRWDNASGTPGVWFEERTKKWAVMIGTGTGRKGLGRYATKKEAIRVRKAAQRALGYSKEYGRKAS